MTEKLTNGTFKHCDDSYDIVGYHKGKVQINKTTRIGIHYNDIKINRIDRKLSKDLTITINKIKYDLTDVSGVKFHHEEYLSNLAKKAA